MTRKDDDPMSWLVKTFGFGSVLTSMVVWLVALMLHDSFWAIMAIAPMLLCIAVFLLLLCFGIAEVGEKLEKKD
jgi:hypothetical protein